MCIIELKKEKKKKKKKKMGSNDRGSSSIWTRRRLNLDPWLVWRALIKHLTWPSWRVSEVIVRATSPSVIPSTWNWHHFMANARQRLHWLNIQALGRYCLLCQTFEHHPHTNSNTKNMIKEVITLCCHVTPIHLATLIGRFQLGLFDDDTG